MATTRAEPLEAARTMLRLPLTRLWLDYIGLGGNLPPTKIQAILTGRADIDDHNHDLIVQALNERFADHDNDHPMAYADELPPRG
jgi:hypothetical protein